MSVFSAISCTGATCTLSLSSVVIGAILALLCGVLLGKWSPSLLRRAEPATAVDKKLAPALVPHHIAAIMDGNRRYGRMMFGPGAEIRGHRAGGEVLHNCIGWCQKYGVKVLTVYAFSTENWKRDPKEIAALMAVFASQCPRIKKDAVKIGMRVNVISSDFQRLQPSIQAMLRDLEATTKHLTKFVLNLCVSYGGRGEIAQAAQALAKQAVLGTITPESIDEESIASQLQTAGIPDPDLVFRTSGEYRLSNFLLWQVGYSEMIFVKKHWPQLEEADFVGILDEFARRGRRFGK